jgi:hypothetical protein
MKTRGGVALGTRVCHCEARSAQDVNDIPAGGTGLGEEASGPGNPQEK